jgi:hypothetical protein
MNEITGEHSQAVFAADGKARHRLVRAAVTAGVALLASWLIALALGVFGGFGSLPGLPESRSSESNAASPRIQPAEPSRAVSSEAPDLNQRATEPSVRAATPTAASRAPSRTRTESPTQNTTPKSASQTPIAPSAPPAPTASASNNGRHLGAGKPATTGKPAEAPGSGPAGTGPPGQQR